MLQSSFGTLNVHSSLDEIFPNPRGRASSVSTYPIANHNSHYNNNNNNNSNNNNNHSSISSSVPNSYSRSNYTNNSVLNSFITNRNNSQQGFSTNNNNKMQIVNNKKNTMQMSNNRQNGNRMQMSNRNLNENKGNYKSKHYYQNMAANNSYRRRNTVGIADLPKQQQQPQNDNGMEIEQKCVFSDFREKTLDQDISQLKIETQHDKSEIFMGLDELSHDNYSISTNKKGIMWGELMDSNAENDNQKCRSPLVSSMNQSLEGLDDFVDGPFFGSKSSDREMRKFDKTKFMPTLNRALSVGSKPKNMKPLNISNYPGSYLKSDGLLLGQSEASVINHSTLHGENMFVQMNSKRRKANSKKKKRSSLVRSIPQISRGSKTATVVQKKDKKVTSKARRKTKSKKISKKDSSKLQNVIMAHPVEEYFPVVLASINNQHGPVASINNQHGSQPMMANILMANTVVNAN